MKLKGKTAVVSGAGQGIGRAVALAFAKEGANISFNYYGEDAKASELASELEASGAKVFFSEGDLTNGNYVKQFIEQTIGALDRIDILVNVAGISQQGLVQDLEESDWDRMLDINLKSVFLTTKYTVPHMISRKSGRIINFASQLGQKGGIGVSHYTASKAGVIAFTKSIALELGQYGITANSVAPGPIETAMLAGYDEEWKQKKLAELPLQRFGQIEEVVPTVMLLASDPDGNIYTGQTLGPNSGDVML
ncbi:SDR family NAD(P)-dependent oxidoreductase [Siminovitchia sediminis]|uniref:SDR family NAD(P)-dependent oxidoreductase n=1 Tax=Siminovitchia sediminis TaxID=1274353 RepID=A0ABW4KL40_9BACI